MSMPLVYLAGPIAHTKDGAAFDWRDHARVELGRFGIESRDPLRAKAALRGMPLLPGDTRVYDKMGVFFQSAGVMTRDHNDVKSSNALLVNLLGAQTISIGTVMEMAWAYDRQIPCVVAIEEDGNPHDKHPMLHEVIRKFRVADLDEAIYCVAVILNRG